MSTHSVPVVRVEEVIPHPNADRLDLIPIKGWRCAVQKGSFKVGDLAVYIEPDYMVPVDHPEFAFLKDPKKPDQTHARIKGKRLRGEMSFGLLIPAPDPNENDVWPGDNLMGHFGIQRWEPPMVGKASGGFQLESKFLPPTHGVEAKFDLENIKNFPDIIKPDEMVVYTEKVHGANARYLFLDGVMYVGSRTRWLRRPTHEEMAQGHKVDAWNDVLEHNLHLQHWCQKHEGTILYGEIFGNVQDLKYGRPNRADFAGFAAYNTLAKSWVPTVDLFRSLNIFCVDSVPVIEISRFDPDFLQRIAEQDSTVRGAPPNHIREGIVVTPVDERIDPQIGRVSLKHVSMRYYERKL